MDYKPPACSRCGYRLPMTWMYKSEMARVMRAAGWKLSPVLCPDCRRKEKWQHPEKKLIEHVCTSCGFSVVTDYPYHPTCPICGEPLISRKPASGAAKPRENKNSKGAK